eukprot:TCONS_00010896-protein
MAGVTPDVEKLRKSTVSLLSSILTAQAKVGIPLHSLAYEYEETVFEKLKIKEMGYGTIQQFITDYSNVFTMSPGMGGHLYVKAIPTDETAHIHRLVAGQKKKTKKKKRKAVVFPVRRFSGPRVARPSTRGGRGGFTFNRNFQQSAVGSSKPFFSKSPAIANRPPTKTFNTFMNKEKTNNLPPRLQRVIDNQMKIKPPPINTFMQPSHHKQNTSFSSSFTQPAASSPIVSSAPLKVTSIASLEQNLKKLLQGKPNGLFATRLRPEYKQKFNEDLPADIKQTIQQSLSHFIQIDSPMPNQEILYYKQDKPLPSPSLTPIQDDNQKNITQLSLSSTNGERNSFASSTLTHPIPTSQVEEKNISAQNISSPAVVLQMSSLILPEAEDQLKVYVCHIEDMNRFFVQLENSTIHILVQEMQDFYNKIAADQYCIAKPKVGEYCVSRFTQDKSWFRAKILSVKEQFNTINKSYRCHVFYPDYGNDEYVLSTELKSLTKDFCDLPCQAIQCCLNNIIPIEGTDWNENAINYFKELVDDIELNLKVIENLGTVLSVDLSDGDGKSVCQHLCTQEYAKEIQPTAPNSPSETRTLPTRLSRSLSLEPTDVLIKASWVKPPSEEFVDLCVTHIVSSCTVYAKLVGTEYHEKLDLLETAINNSFENASVKPAAILETGQYYVALHDDEWFRAQLLSIDEENDDYTMFLVDSGKETIVSKEEIKNIQPKFLRLPFQAIKCNLKDVPERSDIEILSYMTAVLLGKANLGCIYEKNVDTSSETVSKVVLCIYDDFSQDGLEINTVLIEKIEEENKLVPRLPEIEEEACAGFLTHINEDNDFFIQIMGHGLERLDTITKDISSHFSQHSRAAEIIATPDIGQLCCAKWPKASNWYRARVTQIFYPQRKVEVEFIDYGNTEVIHMVLIRKPLAVSQSVVTLPFQAIKVKLDGVQQLQLEDENMRAKLREFIYSLDEVPLQIKNIGTENGTPVVRISIPVLEQGRSIDLLEGFQEFITVDDFADNGDGLNETSENLNTNDTVNSTFVNISSLNNTLTEHASNNTLSEWDVISPGNSPVKPSLSHINEEKSSSGVSSSDSITFTSPRHATPAITFSQRWGIPDLKISDRTIPGLVQDVHDPSKFSIIPYDCWEELMNMFSSMQLFYNVS